MNQLRQEIHDTILELSRSRGSVVEGMEQIGRVEISDLVAVFDYSLEDIQFEVDMLIRAGKVGRAKVYPAALWVTVHEFDPPDSVVRCPKCFMQFEASPCGEFGLYYNNEVGYLMRECPGCGCQECPPEQHDRLWVQPWLEVDNGPIERPPEPPAVATDPPAPTGPSVPLRCA